MAKKNYKLVDGSGEVFAYQIMNAQELDEANKEANYATDGVFKWVEMEDSGPLALRCPNCNHEIHLGLPLVPSMVIEGVQYRIDHVESLPHPGQRDFVAEDSEHRIPIVFVAPI